eukprot:3861898-Pleurochrysis_carterae.AAC.2
MKKVSLAGQPPNAKPQAAKGQALRRQTSKYAHVLRYSAIAYASHESCDGMIAPNPTTTLAARGRSMCTPRACSMRAARDCGLRATRLPQGRVRHGLVRLEADLDGLAPPHSQHLRDAADVHQAAHLRLQPRRNPQALRRRNPQALRQSEIRPRWRPELVNQAAMAAPKAERNPQALRQLARQL